MDFSVQLADIRSGCRRTGRRLGLLYRGDHMRLRSGGLLAQIERESRGLARGLAKRRKTGVRRGIWVVSQF